MVRSLKGAVLYGFCMPTHLHAWNEDVSAPPLLWCSCVTVSLLESKSCLFNSYLYAAYLYTHIFLSFFLPPFFAKNRKLAFTMASVFYFLWAARAIQFIMSRPHSELESLIERHAFKVFQILESWSQHDGTDSTHPHGTLSLCLHSLVQGAGGRVTHSQWRWCGLLWGQSPEGCDRETGSWAFDELCVVAALFFGD